MIKFFFGIYKLVMLPVRRARGMRDDDRAQVMVLTAIMAFIIAIMGVTTFNAGTLMYNRVRAQNAVDAAADSFAAYQSRGLNLSQHLNDIHYYANWVAFGLETANWLARTLCPLAGIKPPPVFYEIASVRACCSALQATGRGIDELQHGLAEVILAAQAVIDVAFPIIGALSANSLAEANGADPVVSWVPEVAAQVVGIIGIDISGFTGALGGLGDLPVIGDFYVIPLQFDQLASLNTEEKDPDPDSLPWDTMGIIQTMVTVSDVACAIGGDSAMSNEPSHDYGWTDDTYYCGGPAYNTWIAGMTQHDAFPNLRRIAWLNPNIGAADMDPDMYAHQDDYGTFDHRSNVAGNLGLFRNPAFATIASSHVEGSPLMEYSNHSNFDDYSTPHLISVHTGNPGSDSTVNTIFIWH